MPSRYDVATSTPVRITSTTAISTYWRGPGWRVLARPRPGADRRPATSVAAAVGAGRPRCSSSVTRSVPVGHAHVSPQCVRDQVDRGEDEDPHDVDEVPVEPGDLDRLATCSVGSRPCIERPHSDSNQMMPIVTCAPCRPVSTKNVVPNMLRAEVQALAVELGELVDLAADERQRRRARWRAARSAAAGGRRAGSPRARAPS